MFCLTAGVSASDSARAPTPGLWPGRRGGPCASREGDRADAVRRCAVAGSSAYGRLGTKPHVPGGRGRAVAQRRCARGQTGASSRGPDRRVAWRPVGAALPLPPVRQVVRRHPSLQVVGGRPSVGLLSEASMARTAGRACRRSESGHVSAEHRTVPGARCHCRPCRLRVKSPGAIPVPACIHRLVG